MENRKLTEKQQKFTDYYIECKGNATEAAIKAGYSKNTAAETGYENLRKPHIMKTIGERNKQLESIRIAGMEEVKEFWTTTMREEGEELRDRLKASEYLAKTNGAFIDRVEQTGNMGLVVKWGNEDE